jgi:hypothetical protein
MRKSTKQLLERMDRMGFAAAGEALGEIECLGRELAATRSDYDQLRLMLGSLLDITVGRMEEAEIARHFGMLGLDVVKRAKAARDND